MHTLPSLKALLWIISIIPQGFNYPLHFQNFLKPYLWSLKHSKFHIHANRCPIKHHLFHSPQSNMSKKWFAIFSLFVPLWSWSWLMSSATSWKFKLQISWSVFALLTFVVSTKSHPLLRCLLKTTMPLNLTPSRLDYCLSNPLSSALIYPPHRHDSWLPKNKLIMLFPKEDKTTCEVQKKKKTLYSVAFKINLSSLLCVPFYHSDNLFTSLQNYQIISKHYTFVHIFQLLLQAIFAYTALLITSQPSSLTSMQMHWSCMSMGVYSHQYFSNLSFSCEWPIYICAPLGWKFLEGWGPVLVMLAHHPKSPAQSLDSKCSLDVHCIHGWMNEWIDD